MKSHGSPRHFIPRDDKVINNRHNSIQEENAEINQKKTPCI